MMRRLKGQRAGGAVEAVEVAGAAAQVPAVVAARVAVWAASGC